MLFSNRFGIRERKKFLITSFFKYLTELDMQIEKKLWPCETVLDKNTFGKLKKKIKIKETI